MGLSFPSFGVEDHACDGLQVVSLHSFLFVGTASDEIGNKEAYSLLTVIKTFVEGLMRHRRILFS